MNILCFAGKINYKQVQDSPGNAKIVHRHKYFLFDLNCSFSVTKMVLANLFYHGVPFYW